MYRDLDLFFTALPGAAVDDDYLYPLGDLLPVNRSSMVRHGQLPPLRNAVAAPTCLSSTDLNTRADSPPVVPPITSSSSPVPVSDAWVNSEQDGKEKCV